MRGLEYSLEEARAELSHKNRQIQENHDVITDMKNQLADIREAKSTCEKEVRVLCHLVYICYRVG